ncbi:hypothetical protein [Solirubrobacter ginsenosidimutans]|uniref:hypothetical protein n=1 Tax=Solirubrobacter ginsenosidimutans TaxID=490573 RepID=UPI0022CE01D2|nr:hypothetical protein [Solirubrobacter ginsenosidimutans]
MAIAAPADESVLVSPATVALQGRLDEPVAIGLYFRWYSSLGPASKDHYALNEQALTDAAAVLRPALAAGTHVLTFAASDQLGQDAAAQAATRSGGVAGGAAGPTKCIVHVLRATLRAPAAGASLSKAGAQIDAEGPPLWGDAGYQAINRLRYRLRFDPSPADGRPSADLVPALTVVAGGAVRYSGTLPPQLGSGAYTLRLRVEDKLDANVHAEDARAVVITA